MRLVALPSVALMLLCACGVDRLSDAEGKLVTSEEEVAFGRTLMGAFRTRTLQLGLTQDESGNLYLLENSTEVANDTKLLSFTPDGFERFQLPVPEGTVALSVHSALPQLLSHGRTLRAYSLTGQVLWTIDTADLDSGEGPHVGSVVALDNPPRWAVHVETGSELHNGRVVVIRAGDGAVLWDRSWPGHLNPLASLTGEELRVGGTPCWGNLRPVETLDGAQGALLTTGPAMYLDSWTHDLFVARENPGVRLRDAAGAEIVQSSLDWISHRMSRIGTDHVWLTSSGTSPTIEITSRSGWSAIQTKVAGKNLHSLELTSRGSGLTFQQGIQAKDDRALVEIRADGATEFSCPVPTDVYAVWLGTERVYAWTKWNELAAWDAPGLAVASEGFASPSGSPLRNGRAR